MYLPLMVFNKVMLFFGMVLIHLYPENINFNCWLYFQDAKSVIEPKNCALIIGLTYFFSAILSLVLKNLIGRRILLLMSQLGMAVSQIALGVYFYILSKRTPVNSVSERNSESSNTTVNNLISKI